MAQFDAAAATAAYLAVLTPAQHAKAQAYTQGGHWLLLWGAIVSVLVSWLVLRSGVLVKIRDGIEKGSPKPVRVAFAVLIVDAVLEFFLNLPWSAYADWWRETGYGLTSRPFGGWLGEQLAAGLISAILFTLLLVGLYTLMRKAPKTWWLWGSGVVALFFVVVMILAPVFIMPLFNKYQPAPAGPVRDEIVAMAKSVGVPSDKIFIYDGSKQSNRYTANVAGLGSTSRIAMSDVMFKKDADIAEVRGVVGHEMGHYVHAHVFIFAALYAALALVGFFIIDRAFAPVARMLGAKDVRGLSDPAGFPILAILLTVLSLVSTPIRVSITRIGEADADTFSLEHFNEPDGLAKALVKTIEYRAATPSKLEEVLFYDHPSVGSRVRKAMDWKAAQQKVDGVS